MMQVRRSRSDAVQAPLETYLHEVNETPLLTAIQERQLATAIGEGNGAARDHMVRANLRLVINVARSYGGRGLSLQDLIAEGNLGLLRAVEAFHPSMNTRFSTYASYWIKQSIRQALISTAKTIRIPAYMLRLLDDWRRAAASLQEELGRAPSQDEIAKHLGLSRKKVAIIKKALRIYNATPQTEQGEAGWSMEELVMDVRAKSPDSDLMHTDDLQHVLKELHRLPEREATVLRMRFGLDDEEALTLKEIGRRLGLTRERVRQIERDALRKLSETFAAE